MFLQRPSRPKHPTPSPKNALTKKGKTLKTNPLQTHPPPTQPSSLKASGGSRRSVQTLAKLLGCALGASSVAAGLVVLFCHRLAWILSNDPQEGWVGLVGLGRGGLGVWGLGVGYGRAEFQEGTQEFLDMGNYLSKGHPNVSF